ncbi:MAG: potassium-transporting ATPase subunit KdpC [Proteobacteria bacterium]|nr:potassium-transporting ATPase subunit KdpC [Pseudomonadota bacterium]
MSQIRPALVLLALFTLLFGVIYPFAITGIAQLAFPSHANGSLIERNGQVVGSALIGQSFSRPEYFWPRPSAAGQGYDASASSGSNYGASSRALVDRVRGDVSRLHQGGVQGRIPADLATASGSGLDPHISPAAAQAQVARVAAARHLSEQQVAALVARYTEPPFLGLIGEATVNVLRLNLALDETRPAGP